MGDLRELAGLDLDAVAEGRAPGFGTATERPVVLVCTHGRRDVCCARLGRPAAALLDRRLPGLVWESTHVGGDRFAANVVALPDGTYHGRVTARDVDDLADAVLTRRVLPALLRGRAGLPAPVQAADHHVRARYGVRVVDAVQPLRHELVADDGTVRVEMLLTGIGTCVVHVRPRRSVEAGPAPCARLGAAAGPRTYDLVALELRAEAG